MGRVFVAGTLGRKGERVPAIVDAGLEATSREDAADHARVIANVPIAIEMRLNLERNRPGAILVTLGKGDAEGGQRQVGAEFAGIVIPATFLGTAIEPLGEVNGNAAHDDDPFSSMSPRLICPKVPPPGRLFQSITRQPAAIQPWRSGAYFAAVARMILRRARASIDPW